MAAFSQVRSLIHPRTLNKSLRLVRKPHYVRMRNAAKHGAAPIEPRPRARPHCLAEIVERGAGVLVDCARA